MEELEEEYAIGLDLGTTFSCIGVYRNGGVEIIPNKNGEKTTPSIVIITEDENILVGEDTTDFLVKNYDNCIYEIKRLIGRKYSEKEVQEEMKKLPYKIIHANKGDFPEVEIKVKGKKVNYNPVEISSFIIKKMVKNAESYLNKKISKLVITVPAYFNDSQRKLTKQAAELVGLKVIRVVNEPTAAALSYGFDKKQDMKCKILIFDLGGGTFDVSILSLIKDEKDENRLSFAVLGTSGDTQLGGEDFDNELVDYFLKKRKENENEIRKNNQSMKKLKIACENVKKILSSSENTTLRINNFYNDEDLIEPITRKDFEEKCQNLFKRLLNPLDEALRKAKLEKNEINEVILVGGSTRIPKVKEIVKEYFPGCSINDSINPDEAVAYGATLNAEKILHNKDDSITNFHLLDIIPLSLGTDVRNNSKDPEIKKEGLEMSIILKRGTYVPISNSRVYSTSEDDQTSMSMNIYEGEKKYVKYNHLLKKSNINGLTPRPKGKTKVLVTFDIDINGILLVKAQEQSENGKTLELTIKNDEISLTNEQIEQLKQKNKALIEKMKNTTKFDYTNFKNLLKQYKDAYDNCSKEKSKKKNDDDDDEEEDPRITYITNYNNTLEDFIDSFDKKFDNETVLEKLYLYIKELFLSYIETFKLGIDRGDQEHIIEKVREYVKIFIDKSSGYLNNLIEILYNLTKTKKNKLKKLFYNTVIFIMEKLNEYGKECIKSNKKFCKYHSLMYFEQSKGYYDKYLSKIDEAKLDPKELKSLKTQKEMCLDFINDINSGAIVLLEESFKEGILFNQEIISTGRGITNDLKKLSLGNIQNKIERCKIVLSNYEKVLSSIQMTNKISKKEAICIANIIKLNEILGYFNSKNKTLLTLAERCELIIEHENINRNEKWCKEFIELYESLKKKKKPDDDYQAIFNVVKQSHGSIFKEIDAKFNKTNGNIEFIEYILKKYPFKNYEKEKEKRQFDNYNTDLIKYLFEQYQPDNYTSTQDENSRLKYCISHEIAKKLSKLLTTF